jgi:arylsulfatase A-like enzyme
MIATTDGFLKRLWTTVQNMPEYRNSTTLIVTSDHGRGSTLADWSGHGSKVIGADKIWLAILGPDTPAAGEVTTHVEQRDIAPTIIKLMGLNPADYKGATGSPIAAAVP